MSNKMLWAFSALPQNYVCLDFETTGLFEGNTPPDPITLGIVSVEDGQITSRSLFKVRPAKRISPHAYAVHGISDEEARDYPPLSASWPEIRSLVENQLIVIHNASFDWRIFENAAQSNELAIDFKVLGVFCSQRAAQPWAEATGIRCSSRGPALDDLLAELKFAPRSEWHNALEDAEFVFKVVERLRSLGDPTS